MRKILILAAIAALDLASAADAKSCKDAKGHFVKCPAAAAATPVSKAPTHTLWPKKPQTPGPVQTQANTAPSGAPHCTKGKPCGHSCIAVTKVCHKS